MAEESPHPEFEALVRKAAAIQEKYLLDLVEEYGTGVLTMPVSPQHCQDVAEVFTEILEDPRHDKEFKAELLAMLLYHTDQVRAAVNARALRQAKNRKNANKR